MRKIIAFTLFFTWGVVNSFGQLTQSQESLIKKYQEKQNLPADYETEKFSSPEYFTEETQTASSDDVAQQTPGAGQGLVLFGHNIFTGSGALYAPDLVALPPADYTLGPGDNLIVNVWGRVDLELTLTVDREGKVFIPRVGELVAVGKTLEQFKQNLKDKLSAVYSDYHVSVALGKLRQIRIFVFGEVNKPGGYSVSSLATLLHALYIADGITANGSLRDIRLIRNTKVFSHYDLYDLLLKGDTKGDLKLLSGDVVYVPVTGPLVSIFGEVKRPAIYELTRGERATDLIELAGGTKPTVFLESISLDRVGPDDSRILKDLDLADTTCLADNNIILQDGDIIKVPSIYDFHENMVQLTGHVKHPGLFGCTDSMRISELIAYGEQLKGSTYRRRADLYRTYDNGEKEVIPVDLVKILEGDQGSDIYLQPFDDLVIYSNEQVKRKKSVSITGAIKKPNVYPLFQDMKLTDLIFLAGNLTKQAYMVRAEIARANPGNPPDIIFVNLEDILINKKPGADIFLKEDDHVFIRLIPDWRPVQIVTIEGEVFFSGQYAIKQKDERLSDLIKRAGGLTPSAFSKGATFYRGSIEGDVTRRNIGQIIENSRETQMDSLGHPITSTKVDFNPPLLNRIIIDLDKILKEPGEPRDIVLAGGDQIYIPTYPSGIQVIGAVAANGTIAYVKDKKAKFYIGQAGGFTPDADKSEIRLVKPDGKVFYGRKARRKVIELGDAVVVPSRLKSKTDWSDIITSTAAILGSVATTIFVIDRIK